MTTHFVTGGTGFVGAALVLELLDRTDDDVVALARPGDGSAHERMVSAVQGAAKAYGRDPSELPLHRLRGVAGDVTRPCCGVEDDVVADVLWHSAASLRYEDRYADEIMATNVGGTRNVLDLAERMGVDVVNTVSTAYVVGSRQGRQHEALLDEAPSQNHYERSKIAAEHLARAAGPQVRIFRPSIVVGHSRTFAATTFSGLYGFTRQMVQFRGVLERMQAGLYRTRRVQVRVTENAEINLVPVDAVAAQAVHIGLQSDASGVYHLTQSGGPTVGEAMRAVAAQVGFAEPEFVDVDAELDWIDAQFDKRLDFYGSYVRGDRTFDRSRADAALNGRADLHRALPPVEDLTGWYLGKLEQERRSLPVSR